MNYTQIIATTEEAKKALEELMQDYEIKRLVLDFIAEIVLDITNDNDLEGYKEYIAEEYNAELNDLVDKIIGGEKCE